MKQRGKHRQALIWAAARQFRRHGYAATGLRDILAASGAPRGSLYHYFPGGKEEIGAAAVEAAGRMVSDTFTGLAEGAESPVDFIRGYTSLLAGWLEESSFQDGCPITTILLETSPASQRIAAAGRAVFTDWQRIVAGLLVNHDWPADRAKATAVFIIAGFEGALVLARVQSSVQPIIDTQTVLCALVAAPQGRGHETV